MGGRQLHRKILYSSPLPPLREYKVLFFCCGGGGLEYKMAPELACWRLDPQSVVLLSSHWGVGSMGKGACCPVWQPGLNSWDPYDRVFSDHYTWTVACTQTNVTNSLGGYGSTCLQSQHLQEEVMDFWEFQASLALCSGFQGSQGNIMKLLLQEKNFFKQEITEECGLWSD